jgi:hypothetical protein
MTTIKYSTVIPGLEPGTSVRQAPYRTARRAQSTASSGSSSALSGSRQ